jgi:hypothetical protein
MYSYPYSPETHSDHSSSRFDVTASSDVSFGSLIGCSDVGHTGVARSWDWPAARWRSASAALPHTDRRRGRRSSALPLADDPRAPTGPLANGSPSRRRPPACTFTGSGQGPAPRPLHTRLGVCSGRPRLPCACKRWLARQALGAWWRATDRPTKLDGQRGPVNAEARPQSSMPASSVGADQVHVSRFNRGTTPRSNALRGDLATSHLYSWKTRSM